MHQTIICSRYGACARAILTLMISIVIATDPAAQASFRVTGKKVAVTKEAQPIGEFQLGTSGLEIVTRPTLPAQGRTFWLVEMLFENPTDAKIEIKLGGVRILGPNNEPVGVWMFSSKQDLQTARVAGSEGFLAARNATLNVQPKTTLSQRFLFEVAEQVQRIDLNHSGANPFAFSIQ